MKPKTGIEKIKRLHRWSGSDKCSHCGLRSMREVVTGYGSKTFYSYNSFLTKYEFAPSCDPKKAFEFNSFPEPNTGCWLWAMSCDSGGYGLFALGNGDKQIKAHRAAYILFKGPIPKNKMVLHKCDVRCCVNPDHLFIGTQTDNMRDMAAKGRTSIRVGEESQHSPFTNKDVLAIRKLHSEGFGIGPLSAFYLVTYKAIELIVKRKTWRHI